MFLIPDFKGYNRVRQLLLPKNVSRALLALRGDTGANGPVLALRKNGGDLDEHNAIRAARLSLGER